MPLTILYVEDNKVVADAVAETLASEGWRVELCADGLAGLRRIEGDAHYDLRLLDNELPYLSGIALVRRARKLPHRARTPIIVISASEAEYGAREAGSDLFLKKPEGLRKLTLSIRRVLNLPG